MRGSMKLERAVSKGEYLGEGGLEGANRWRQAYPRDRGRKARLR